MIQIQEHYLGQPKPPAIVPPAITPPGVGQPAPQTRVANGVQELSKDVADYVLVALAAMYPTVSPGATQTPDLQTYNFLTEDTFSQLTGTPPQPGEPVGPGVILEAGGISPSAIDPNSPRMIVRLSDLARWQENGIADYMTVNVARTRQIAAGLAEPGSDYAVIVPLEGAIGAGAAPRKRSATPIIVGGIVLAAIAAAALG